jgi:uncharacterized protein (TIGR00661 family)
VKILFGVQATGNGHISRAREMIRALREAGDEVHVLLSGRDRDKLWDMEVFEPYVVRRGLTYITSRGKVKYLATARQLHFLELYRDVASYDASDFDLVLTDFEPIAARIARRRGIPSIGLGHQYAFWYDVPVAGRNPIARLAIKYFAPADYAIGLHWHHFDQPILPPIIPPISTDGRQTVEQKILVYLPFENLEEVTELFQPVCTHDFYVYSEVEHPRDEGNVHFRPCARAPFLNDLINCNGIISNAGFELLAEALHLGKKLLVKPLAGQLEQRSNALALKQLGLGTVMERLDRDMTGEWLKKPPLLPMEYPDVAKEIATWIHRDFRDGVQELAERAWSLAPRKCVQ